ncbi:alpha/beta fold hydrolase [Microbulbifer magnicolonia]|uniref:alpha/beta fold hydrolase n=1 Tax=Microbulbifer magnicolonia TaxID=3109744 RepID=UPI002B413675|nr:alpha/beta fold hydrolase [Microbulbifer sp. GG15]
MPHFVHGERRLYFADSGGGGEPLLLLHGLGSRSDDWQLQWDPLAAEFRVLALDIAGHGASDPLCGPVTMADLAGDALALLDHLGIARTHVGGFSLGGMLAFQLATDRPERLLSLTVINSGPGFASGRWRLLLTLALRTLMIRGFGLPTLAKRIALKLFPRDSQQPLREQFLRSVAAADQKSYLKILRAIAAFNVRARLGNCTVPALILCGDQDYTPTAFKQEYATLLPDARLRLVADSRHATPLDQAEICNDAIIEFLRSVNAPGQGEKTEQIENNEKTDENTEKVSLEIQ